MLVTWGPAPTSLSAAFYDAVLAPLGASRLMDFGVAMGYGVPAASRLLDRRVDSGEGFRDRTSRSRPRSATSSGVLRRRGGERRGGADEPRSVPEYHEHYFGASSGIRTDNVEAVCHVPATAEQLDCRS